MNGGKQTKKGYDGQKGKENAVSLSLLIKSLYPSLVLRHGLT